MTTWYELGATVTLTQAGAADDAAQLFVTAPDATESTPSVTFSAGTGLWSGSVTANQYDQWEYAWRLDGSIVETGVFTVGGPWYILLSQLRADLNIPAANAARDAMLARALTSGARQIEQYCDGRVFYLAGTATARTFPTRRRICTAEGYRLPVDDIGHATITAEVGDGTTWTELSDVEPWPFNALVKSEPATGLVSQTDWSRYRLARVTTRWGWPATPAQISEAHLRQSSRLYRRKDSPEGVAGSSEWGLIRVPNFDPDIRALLAPFVNSFRVA